MTTIAQIIREGKGYAGSNNAWRAHKVESDPFVGQTYELWHYSTLMLRWIKCANGTIIPLYASTGHGSVSDQGGMNTAFKILRLPYRFDRAGGARITDLQVLRHEDEGWSDAMRWDPKQADDEIAEWRKILDS